jgi:hypothetical protein
MPLSAVLDYWGLDEGLISLSVLRVGSATVGSNESKLNNVIELLLEYLLIINPYGPFLYHYLMMSHRPGSGNLQQPICTLCHSKTRVILYVTVASVITVLRYSS